MTFTSGSGQGGFVTETRQQAIDFYRELFQQLTEWRPKAPKLREKRTEPKPPQENQQTRPAWEAPPTPDREEATTSSASPPEEKQ